VDEKPGAPDGHRSVELIRHEAMDDWIRSKAKDFGVRSDWEVWIIR
jgi:hypothetical protein